MDDLLRGRVVVVTGAGQGLGRAHALECARLGARVVVNDHSPAAEETAGLITEAGGEAVSTRGDVSDWAYAEELIDVALQRFGRVDTLINNAGINRDRTLVNMSEREWDDVLRVNLKGHFAPMHHAAVHWRGRSKAGEEPTARIVNTSSGAGLFGSVGQGNYAAAKAGIAALTLVAAAEWRRYGICVNAIAPSARTPMTETVFAEMMARPETGFDAMDPGNVSPLVAWLGSAEAGVSGLMFEIEGGKLSLTDGWRHGAPVEVARRWRVGELADAVARLVADAEPPDPVYGA